MWLLSQEQGPTLSKFDLQSRPPKEIYFSRAKYSNINTIALWKARKIRIRSEHSWFSSVCSTSSIWSTNRPKRGSDQNVLTDQPIWNKWHHRNYTITEDIIQGPWMYIFISICKHWYIHLFTHLHKWTFTRPWTPSRDSKENNVKTTIWKRCVLFQWSLPDLNHVFHPNEIFFKFFYF